MEILVNKSIKLFSYIVKYDWGAAPNPYWGYCTLVICKPRIRNSTAVGNWIVGSGSANNPYDGKDYSNKIIYAMKVTDVVELEKYNEICLGKTDYGDKLAKKIPKYSSKNYPERMGDCIYYNISYEPKKADMRLGVHGNDCLKRDLSSNKALISNHYYYFGEKAIDIKGDLEPIIATTQGHRSNANKDYAQEFIDWISSGEFNEFKNPHKPKPILEKFQNKLPKIEGDKPFRSPCDMNDDYREVVGWTCINRKYKNKKII